MRVGLFVLLLFPLLVLAADDVEKSEVPRGPGALAGTWDGPWGNAYQKGRMLMEISKDGKVKGQLTNETMDLDGTLEGTIQNDGQIPAVIKFSYRYSDGEYTGRGTGLLDGDGRLIVIAEVFEKDKSRLGAIAITLSPRSLP